MVKVKVEETGNMPITKMSSKNQIVIPKEARKGMGIKTGDQLIVETINGVTIIRPMPKNLTKFLRGIAKGIYPKNYLHRERASW